MTAKQYLQQIQRYDTRIKHKALQIEEIRTQAAGLHAIDYSADRVQASPSDRLANVISRWYELECQLTDLCDRYIRRKAIIIQQIESLPDERYVQVLYKRYVEYKSMVVVANEMYYAYEYCCRIHGHALRAFYNAYLRDG